MYILSMFLKWSKTFIPKWLCSPISGISLFKTSFKFLNGISNLISSNKMIPIDQMSVLLFTLIDVS